MKNIVTSFALLLATTAITNAQTTATNWTASDCSSNMHTLFTELDAGKVVVFSWVMPCSACITPSKTAYNVVQSYATSNPGKVVFYLADDLGDANCSTISNWVTTNNIGSLSNMTVMDNTGNMINENDFGGSGMPHIVVMGGANHTIYFNKKNSAANDATGIQNAINSAIGATSVADLNNAVSFSVSPNPVADQVTISTSKAVTKVSVMSLSGQVVKDEVYANAKTNPTVNLSQLASGVYMIKITDADNKTGIQKIVKQ
jgi:hypothetical protein